MISPLIRWTQVTPSLLLEIGRAYGRITSTLNQVISLRPQMVMQTLIGSGPIISVRKYGMTSRINQRLRVKEMSTESCATIDY